MARGAARRLSARRPRYVRRCARLRARTLRRARRPRRGAARRARTRGGDDPRRFEARCRDRARRIARRASERRRIRRSGGRRAFRRRRRDARRRRRADGRDPRDRAAGRRRRARRAGRAPAQDAARDGRRHPRRAREARRAHRGAALPDGGRRGDDRAAPAGGARGARIVRAARESPRHLATEMGARGPVAARARARNLQDDREASRRAPPRPAALHRGGHRQPASRARRCGDPRRDHRPPQAHLQHLEQDAPEGLRHRRAVRHSRGAHPRRRRQGLLRGARHRPPHVDAASGRVRRLHREAQGQQLPLAAHGGDRAGGQAARSADPHVRDASALRIRRRRALALQGVRKQGRAPRSRVRGPDRVAAAGARLEGRGRRRVRVARRVQEQSLHRYDLRADAAGESRRPAARLDARGFRVRRAHEPRPPLPRRARRRRDGPAQPRARRTVSASRSSPRRSRARRATG